MAVYELAINGRRVSISGRAPEASLERITVRYAEPRELVFKFAGENILYAEVELKVDGTVRFFGHVLDRVLPDGLVGTLCTYTAYGLEEETRGLSLVNTDNQFPVYNLRYMTMREAFEKIFNDGLIELLKGYGIVAEFVGATDDKIPPIQLRANMLSDAMSVITSAIPGFTWLIDPDTRTFVITNVFDAEPYTVTLGEAVVPHRDLQIRESLRDRVTAVLLIGDGSNEVVTKSFDLVPAWNADLERYWTIDKAQDGGGWANVYRRFSFEAVSTEVLYDEMLELRQVVQGATGSSEHSVDVAAVDSAGFIWAKLPMVSPVPGNRANLPNVRLAGKARPPAGATLVYRAIEGEAPPWALFPADGFSGTAFDIYGLERGRTFHEPSNGNVTVQRAIRIHKAHSDVIYEGSLSLVGEVPAELWNLGRRLNIAKLGGVTGFENAGAVLSELEFNFRSNRMTLRLGGDNSPFLGEGMG